MFWFTPTTNIINVSGTPDYLNQCNNANVSVPNNYFGYQFARSGVGYCGLVLYLSNQSNAREYIESPLSVTLQSNNCYHFEMYVNLANTCSYTTEDIGIYFSDTAVTGINNWNPLPFTPQINNVAGNVADTLNWTLVTGNYIASGSENYLIIGNFKNDSTTDTIPYGSGFPYIYFYIDDVSLTPCMTGINEPDKNVSINISPNPVTDKLIVSSNNHEEAEIIIYDIASRIIAQVKFTNAVSLNTGGIAKGIYFYEVKNRNGVIKKGKVAKE